ncbi:uncharacterized protein [Drosophila suzukii]|uniref:DUF4806 domain-containing protein n=1 Tax=Drosophila suzukii TaxID=28584 RepID=A0ABM4TUR3_DROSZ
MIVLIAYNKLCRTIAIYKEFNFVSYADDFTIVLEVEENSNVHIGEIRDHEEIEADQENLEVGQDNLELEEVLQTLREISVISQKLDILADKVAKTTAIWKVSFAPDKEISGVVPFPLKTEEELDAFENSLTPELIGFYTKKISKIIGSEPLSKRFKLVIAEEMINNYNMDGSNGKKSLRSCIGFYGVLKGALAKDSEDPDIPN